MALGDLQELKYNYELILCKNDKTQISVIDYMDLSYTANFEGSNELSFKLSENDINFNNIKPSYLILMNKKHNDIVKHSEYFSINAPEKSSDNGVTTIQVNCVSTEYAMFNTKILRGYKNRGSELVYDPVGTNGIINYMLDKIYNTWSVNYNDSYLLDKYHVFEFDKNTYMDVFKQIEKDCNCKILFDNINNEINIYDIASYGEDTGLILSDMNYIKKITSQDDISKMITRLYITGKDNITIAKYNPTGRDYVENYDWFINNGYFSPSLASAWNSYKALVQSKTGEITSYLNQIETYETSLLTKQAELEVLKTDLESIEDLMENIMKNKNNKKNNSTYDNLYTQKVSKKAQITSKTSEINTLNNNITTAKDNIQTVQDLLSYENNFTNTQLQELVNYINEDTKDLNTVSDSALLYDYAVAYLDKLSFLPITFSTDTIDIFNCKECQFDWDRLNVGNFIHIHFEELGYNYLPIRLMSYTHNDSSNSLSLNFSNSTEIQIKESLLAKRLVAGIQAQNTLEVNKDSYGKYENEKDTLIKSGDVIDTSENEIIAGTNVINKRGFTGVDIGGYGSIKIMDDKIVISTDNWVTWRTLLSGDGLYLENEASTGRIVLTPENGFQIDQKVNGAWDNVLFIDSNNSGALTIDGGWIELLTADNLNKIYFNPTVGIKIQKNNSGTFVDVFSVNEAGNILANDIIANNATIQGVFKTGTTGARIEIDDNGIKSYNSDNNLHGIYIDKSSVNGLADLKLYYNGSELFTVQNDISEVTLKALTNTFLYYSGASNVTVGQGNWEFAGNIGFFGATPVTKTSILDPLATTVSGTASDIYGSSEADMINDLRDDVRNLRTKVLELTNLLQSYGLG